MKNKKASGLDILFMGIILVVFSVAIIIGFKIYSEIDDKFQNSGVINNSRAQAASTAMLNQYPGIIDNGFLFLTMGLAVIAFVLAGLVRIHPIFFVFYIILLGIIIFLAVVFSNIYQGIAEQAEFTAVADSLIFTSHIMNALPFLVGIFGTLLAIVMYKNYQGAL